MVNPFRPKETARDRRTLIVPAPVAVRPSRSSGLRGRVAPTLAPTGPVVFLRGVKGSDPIFADPRPQVAFTGRSNVGKSSLVNALLQTSLARSSSRPGKTTEMNMYGWEGKRIAVDLPGYGYARMSAKQADRIRKMILWYFTAGEAHPRGAVLVIDANVGFTPYDNELLAVFRETALPALVLANKADRMNRTERDRFLREHKEALAGATLLLVSAKKREGLVEARAALEELFGA